jgi:hypothetical protein
VDGEQVVLIGMVLIIFAGVAVIWMAMWNRRHIRELEHRERLAMIDRGLIPPPELDPAGFETRTGLAAPPTQSAARSRSAGVLLIGLGLAMMMLISFTAGAPEIGIGVGGAFALLGAAFFINSTLTSRNQTNSPARDSFYRAPITSNRPPDPPSGSRP